jgi:hypothetical protein
MPSEKDYGWCWFCKVTLLSDLTPFKEYFRDGRLDELFRTGNIFTKEITAYS